MNSGKGNIPGRTDRHGDTLNMRPYSGTVGKACIKLRRTILNVAFLNYVDYESLHTTEVFI